MASKTAVAAAVTAITTHRQWIAALATHRFVIVDAGATWCRPCRALAPVFERLAAANGGKGAAFLTIDIDTAADIAAELEVMSVPTVVLYDTACEAERLVGPSAPKLTAAVADLLRCDAPLRETARPIQT